MIEYIKGNLLTAKAEVLVNTVNCVGVMGQGIALQFIHKRAQSNKAWNDLNHVLHKFNVPRRFQLPPNRQYLSPFRRVVMVYDFGLFGEHSNDNGCVLLETLIKLHTWHAEFFFEPVVHIVKVCLNTRIALKFPR